jgi:hypothetical protein
MSKGEEMFTNNPKFQEFRDILMSNGISLHCFWSTRRDGRKNLYDDIAMFGLIGDGFSPSVSIMIVINYDNEGVGVYTDEHTDTGTVQELANKFAKPRE